MANALTAGNAEYRSKRMQYLLKNNLVARATASFEEKKLLSDGDKVHRPYASRASVRDYTKGVDTTAQDRTITDEYLDIDKTKEITTYIDNIDKIQNKYNLVNQLVDDDAYQLRNEIDGRYLREIINANLDVDDGDIGGTGGNAITLTTSNVVKTFSKTKAVMREGNIEDNMAWNAVVTPSIVSVMEQSMVSNGFAKADSTLQNGYKGDYMGFRIFESNNVCHSTVGTLTGNVSADDTLTVAGVVFTFKAAPSVA
ncbi:MAG: hypothetical protein GY861_28810 [bacterium]|nr:hypothetical protein [bacterium]